jgi:hypothetical protein
MFLIAQHVSSDTPLIIRSSKTVIATLVLHMFVVAGSSRQPQIYVKPEASITVFELLTMSGLSLETF